MSSGLAGFLELTFENETGDDLVDHFHLSAAQEPDSTISHISDGDVESWKREGRPVGKGGFGIAWLERDVKGNTRVIKEVKKVIPGVKTRYWIRELSAMALLSKNKTSFPHFYGWFQDESYVYIAMEHFSLGDLHDCVNTSLPCDQASMVIGQVSCALDIMHRRRITHRDLKPANVLVRHGPPEWQIAVCDFGVSKRIRGITTALHTAFDGDFMAPESLGFLDNGTSGEYSSAVDMWSLGCLAYWLLRMKMPVPRHRMMAHCYRPWPDAANNIETTDIDEAGKDFIFSLLRPEPQQRLTALQARSHGWLEAYSTRTSIPAPTPATTNIKQIYVSQNFTAKDGNKAGKVLASFHKEQNRVSSVSNDPASEARLKSQDNKPSVTQILLEKHDPSLPSTEPFSSLSKEQRVADGIQLSSSTPRLHETSDTTYNAGEPKALRAQTSETGQPLTHKPGVILWDFETDSDNEVTVAMADEVLILQDNPEEEWLSVRRLKSNQEGIMPRAYVRFKSRFELILQKQVVQPDNSESQFPWLKAVTSSPDAVSAPVDLEYPIKEGYAHCKYDKFWSPGSRLYLLLDRTHLRFYEEIRGEVEEEIRIESISYTGRLLGLSDTFEIHLQKTGKSVTTGMICDVSSGTEVAQWVRCIRKEILKYKNPGHMVYGTNEDGSRRTTFQSDNISREQVAWKTRQRGYFLSEVKDGYIR